MDSNSAVWLFQASIGLFTAAAAAALIFGKSCKISNVLSNLICIAASLLGIGGSVLQLLPGSQTAAVAEISTSVPLLSFELTVDKLSAFFLLTLCILTAAVSLYSLGYVKHYYGKRRVGLFNFLYAAFVLSMFLVITAGNSLFFFLSWEIMSVLSYFLVVFEHEKQETVKAGTLYVIMTHVAAAFLMIAFMIMFSYTGTFDLNADTSAVPLAVQNVVFVMLLIGFGTKAGIIPLHIWLPKAHPAAASNVSALMSGVMIKTAVYGLLRFAVGYLDACPSWWGVVIIVIGIVSALLGIFYALMESNIKRLLAYSSIENIGIIMMGLGLAFLAYAQGNDLLFALALLACLVHTFNHALFKGGLFMGAGAVQYATHSKNLEDLGGLMKKMPMTGFLMLVFALAISAVVPFNGFVGEWLTYQSFFANIMGGNVGVNILSILGAAALAMTGALALVCFVKLIGIGFLGNPRTEAAANAKEVPLPMTLGMAFLAVLCLAAGVFPKALVAVLDGVIADLAGVSVFGQMQGGWFVTYCSLNFDINSVSPLLMLALLLAAVLVTFAVVRIVSGGKERIYNTWDCGYRGLNSRMQYTAAGYTKPLRIVFRFLYRPKRRLIAEEGESAYFPKTLEYKVETEHIFEKYFYEPLLLKMKNLSQKMKEAIQTGSTHRYLLYILLTMIVLLIYNRVA
ncbi:MAG: proton-conducting transporter membrane subunit [Bacillota bacterium]|jgi:hydrogenase-4 component B